MWLSGTDDELSVVLVPVFRNQTQVPTKFQTSKLAAFPLKCGPRAYGNTGSGLSTRSKTAWRSKHSVLHEDKIKFIGYFFSSVWPKCWVGTGRSSEGRGTKEGLKGVRKPVTTLSGIPSLTLISYEFVICLRASLTSAQNRIDHHSGCLNSSLPGSPKQNNLNEVKFSWGQYLFLS